MSEKVEPHLVYRIVHIGNLANILANGIYVKEHPKFDPLYINIGNSEIISKREEFRVKINGYGFIGEYIPFYFGTQSIMLYNILTGQNGVSKQPPANIVYLCCDINELLNQKIRFFFTDGQANQKFTGHYDNLNNLDKVDWAVVNSADFKKTEADPDRLRRYQAEFLVYQHVPINCINQIVVYDKHSKAEVELLLTNNKLNIPVKVVKKDYYFYF
jgi:hypothetical protein